MLRRWPVARQLSGARLASTGRLGRGQSLVEFALVLPLLLVLIMGGLDFGRLFFGWICRHQLVGPVLPTASNPTANWSLTAATNQDSTSTSPRSPTTCCRSTAHRRTRCRDRHSWRTAPTPWDPRSLHSRCEASPHHAHCQRDHGDTDPDHVPARRTRSARARSRTGPCSRADPQLRPPRRPPRRHRPRRRRPIPTRPDPPPRSQRHPNTLAITDAHATSRRASSRR